MSKEEKIQEIKYLHRCSRRIYEEEITEENISVHYDEFLVISETEKSYLIKTYNGKTKRVIKNCKGSFAHETKEIAFENFKYRTLRSLQISKSKYEIAKIFYNKYVKNN